MPLRHFDLVRATLMADADALAAVQSALQNLLADGHLALSWVAVVDVAGPDGLRYIAHRAGGGADGGDAPLAWAALGMLQSGAAVAQQQVLDGTRLVDGDQGRS